MEELLTTKELADFLRLNEKKVYQLAKSSDIPHVRISGKWLFPKKHIERWIDENVQREKDILIVGSDDVLLSRLLSLYSREKFPESQAFYSSVGSLKGIQALSQRKGQACCSHLLDMASGEYNVPFLQRLLSPQKYIVINMWHRTQGLIVAKSNPLGIKGLEDIAGKKIKYINRNSGSGTRVLFELLLMEKGIDHSMIEGFDNEVNTHMEVALKVFFNEVDVGLGIEYVSYPFGLDFIPVKEERFDLVVPRDLCFTGSMKDFIAYIDPLKINKIAHNLPGYNLRDTGKVIFEG